ncbi:MULTISPECIES: TraR/DksA C4-type zinc finger protein [unclassified Ruegeria]|uniref:TraR/DksA family transcriptional regulator n=1 Tax=unclassified Ruegeria TaxID=2625375 RepID=UPI00148815A3|nr:MULTISPECIES: TraR/DksA C4-type zinc finger protein [unclassified Ruegeria]NOD77320.1 TraR/DksA family transcriptional regulator [Ruegeria sp. HKCCD4332]NOD87743.1 TraR/DksA family transcriptional regulator [Ruegeria sp. HKCCD4318]NOE14113.1 TraR/DksA family transcriptional regulator [Ruegeria sp. HKCCD4318-2]NOG08530.1 TraR/DksA family transcriptional regulator [Ruegeria sp. HKCCD4315]
MNEFESSYFETKIRERLAELEQLSASGQKAQAVVELDQQAVGRLSRMDALQNQAMAKAQQTNRDIEKSRLQAALVRIEEEEYGYCEDCGDRIPDARLTLDLAAIRCVNCAAG